MFQENVEIVRRVAHRWNEGDLSGLLELVHPDVEVRLSGVWMDIPVFYQGYDGLREFMTLFRQAWQEEYSTDLKEFIEVDDEHVLVRQEFRGRGRQGLEVTRTFGHLHCIVAGKWCGFQSWAEWGDALEAVGLHESEAGKARGRDLRLWSLVTERVRRTGRRWAGFGTGIVRPSLRPNRRSLALPRSLTSHERTPRCSSP
jgi:ketosteroid isomerase-like protein